MKDRDIVKRVQTLEYLKKNYSTGRFWKKKKGFRPKKQFKKISDEKLYQLIKNSIFEQIDICKRQKWQGHVTAEGYANEFKVPIHKVTQVFKKLNIEGLLGQRVNNKTDWKWNNSWYYLRGIFNG